MLCVTAINCRGVPQGTGPVQLVGYTVAAVLAASLDWRAILTIMILSSFLLICGGTSESVCTQLSSLQTLERLYCLRVPLNPEA